MGTHTGRAIVSTYGITIAKVLFRFNVSPTDNARERTSDPLITAQRRLRSAFASYSTDDRTEAFARIQGMKQILPDLDIFLNVLSLRSGQDWEQQLRLQIPARDVFYLFWSANAACSIEVEKEWRLAVELRGLQYIDPVPLMDPQEVPPPKELASLHFNDLYLAYIKSSRENPLKTIGRRE